MQHGHVREEGGGEKNVADLHTDERAGGEDK